MVSTKLDLTRIILEKSIYIILIFWKPQELPLHVKTLKINNNKKIIIK